MEYQDLLQSFLEKNYEFCFFNENIKHQGKVLLRHDIDFDVDKAYKMAKIEHSIGIKSTYFFMLRSQSYNLLLKENIEKLKSIYNLGHQISLHFDPTIYDENYINRLKNELIILEKISSFKPDCISFHRPTPYFLQYDKPIGNIRHTYQSIYTKTIKYISDSQGSFRYDHPLNCRDFEVGNSIHLLIHPIWWINENNTTLSKNPAETVNKYLEDRLISDKKHAATNCKPYQDYLNEISKWELS